MEQKVFTKELFDSVKHLKESRHLVDVTMKTEPGIYTFRTYNGVVMIQNLRRVFTDRKEVLFDFCLKSSEFKEGGIYYADAYSRELREKTGTKGKQHRV